MHIDWKKVGTDEQSQNANHDAKSAKVGDKLPPKCNFCTLEEIVTRDELYVSQKNTKR